MSKLTLAALQAQLIHITEITGRQAGEHEAQIEMLKARVAALEDAKPQAHSFRTALGVALAAAPDGVRRAAYYRAHPDAQYVSKIEVDVWCAEL